MKGTFQKQLHIKDYGWVDVKREEVRLTISAYYSPKSAVDDVLDKMIYDGFVFKSVFADYRFKKEGGE